MVFLKGFVPQQSPIPCRKAKLQGKGEQKMTFNEIAMKYGKQYREEMSVERETAYVNDCFDAYEQTEKLAETFWTPFTDYEDKIGQKFAVLRRVDTLDCDLCALPQWHIMLEDGTEIDAYPEEIYESEQQNNGRYLFG